MEKLNYSTPVRQMGMTWTEKSQGSEIARVAIRKLDQERQFKFPDGNCELASWTEIADVINELLQLGASTLRLCNCGTKAVYWARNQSSMNPTRKHA